MPVGGSIESVSIAGQNFAVAADADASRKLGGWENDVQPNGDGTARLIKSRVPCSLSGVTYSIDDDRNDQGFLQGIANRKTFVPVTITYASGAVFSGTMQITSELVFNNQASTAAFDMMGEGNIVKQ